MANNIRHHPSLQNHQIHSHNTQTVESKFVDRYKRESSSNALQSVTQFVLFNVSPNIDESVLESVLIVSNSFFQLHYTYTMLLIACSSIKLLNLIVYMYLSLLLLLLNSKKKREWPFICYLSAITSTWIGAHCNIWWIFSVKLQFFFCCDYVFVYLFVFCQLTYILQGHHVATLLQSMCI